MKYLYAIQDSEGREVCSVEIEPTRVRDVAATYDPTTETARLFFQGEEMVSGSTAGAGEKLTLVRWKVKEKDGKPIAHAVAVVE